MTKPRISAEEIAKQIIQCVEQSNSSIDTYANEYLQTLITASIQSAERDTANRIWGEAAETIEHGFRNVMNSRAEAIAARFRSRQEGE